MKFKIVPRSFCTLAAVMCVLWMPTVGRAQTSHSGGAFIDTFQKHWTTAKELALAVADAMPPESYAFKPVPAEMSFGEQMLHIAQANYGYCAFIADTKSPYAKPEKDVKIEKASAMKDLKGSFDYCTEVIGGLDETKLSQMHGSGKGSRSTMETMLGVMVHMVHHRGQAEVYLRLSGSGAFSLPLSALVGLS